MPTDIARPGLLAAYDDEQIAALEVALGDGDLSKLDARGRLAWYEMRCRAAGLDPLTMPFQWVRMPASGNRPASTVLYAKPEAAYQLAHKHGLSVEFTHRDMLGEHVILVECQVTSPDGRRTRNVGLRSIKNLWGQDLANAHMACHTVALRRAIFSHCGLGDQETPSGSAVVNMDTGEVIEAEPIQPVEAEHALPAPPAAIYPQPAAPRPEATPYADTVMATAQPTAPAAPPATCSECRQALTKSQLELSTRTFGRPLCPLHQRGQPRLGDEAPDAPHDAHETERKRRMAHLHALWRDLYPGTTDDAMRSRLSEMLGREVDSRTTLSISELQQCTAELDAERRDRESDAG